MGPVRELSPELYKRSDIYVEDFDLTEAETPNLMAVGELGQLELGLIKKAENPNRVTIFQSRGKGPTYVHTITIALPQINLKKKVEF